MRVILILWFLPLLFFWGWYALSANDISFGLFFFSRELHDEVFRVYGNILGVSPDVIPGMVAYACVIDSAIILAIAAFRWRAKWWPQTKAKLVDVSASFWNRETSDDQLLFEERQSGRVPPAE